LSVIRMRVPELNARLARQAVELVQSLRQLDLKKNPSVSETIDWARAMVMLNADTLDRQTLENTLTVLLKHESDVQKARRAIIDGGTRATRPDRRSGSGYRGQSWNN
jgi:MoxR-like ATPase